jgi:predicted dehydrogenase
MQSKVLLQSITLVCMLGCAQQQGNSEKTNNLTIIQLDPTHSHAAAAQSEQLENIDSTSYLYSSNQSAVNTYLQQINSFNTRKENPTKWNEIAYYGEDFLAKMVAEKKGDIVVLAGNNRVKIDYIEQSVNAGMNVFSDKPMVINADGFKRLEKIYQIAQQKGVVLFDMMTERYSLINRVQKALMQDTLLFGRLQSGTPNNPAIYESSVHHFYRGGKGSRPAWYFDVLQQGEGITDVTTHLIDLTFWKAFPDQVIDYTADVKIRDAQRSPVRISNSEFKAATSLPGIPTSLNEYLKDSTLEVYANGSITYLLKGVYTNVDVEWRAATPLNGNDLRNAYARGTKSTLFIAQHYGQKQPKLCIKNGDLLSAEEFNLLLNKSLAQLQAEFPGISSSTDKQTVEIILPSEIKKSYDPTFKTFITHIRNKDLPKWEVPNTIAKYFITTTALEMAKRKN